MCHKSVDIKLKAIVIIETKTLAKYHVMLYSTARFLHFAAKLMQKIYISYIARQISSML